MKTREPWRLWPRSLFGRLALILFSSLVAAHALSFGLIVYERTEASMTMMFGYLARDIASSVAILERLSAAEREGWLTRLERRSYRYVLGARGGAPMHSPVADRIVATLSEALGTGREISARAPDDGTERLLVTMHLADGSPLTIELTPSAMPFSPWLPLVLSLQLALLAGGTWLAVRLATRPLTQLARAADALGSDMKGERLVEDGPLEVAHAAAAFNAMQRRIAEHLAERAQILAAISHDLQTPITRMRLRADLLDDDDQRQKLQRDLDAMQALVREGIAYAHSAHGAAEPLRPIDVDALLDSIVCDYRDGGRHVGLSGSWGTPLMARPQALRRIVANLVDNALKFAQAPEIVVRRESPDCLSISVLDRGPGIAPDQLESVLLPFRRLEDSRNRNTGGTGLGLAIVHQLVTISGGTLTLSNRDGGGLEARVSIPLPVHPPPVSPGPAN